MQTAFENGREVAAAGFDWDAVDRGNPLTSELEGASPRGQNKINLMSDSLRDVLDWCWRTKFGPRKLKGAQHCFVALTALVRPELVGDMSYEQIGRRLGVGKSNISRIARSFQKEFGVKFSRSHRADNLHAAAARESWQKSGRVKSWKGKTKCSEV